MHQTNRRGKHDLIMLSSKLHENQPQKSTADNASYRPFSQKTRSWEENPDEQTRKSRAASRSRNATSNYPLKKRSRCDSPEITRVQDGANAASPDQPNRRNSAKPLPFLLPRSNLSCGEPGILKFPCGTRRRRKLLGRREGERNGGGVV